MVEVSDCYYEIPLLSSLQALLQCEDIRDQVKHMHVLFISLVLAIPATQWHMV